MLLPDTLNGRVLVGGDGGLWGCKRSSPTAISPPTQSHLITRSFPASRHRMLNSRPRFRSPLYCNRDGQRLRWKLPAPSSVRISHHQCFLSSSICGGAPRQPDSTGLLQRFAPSFELQRVFCGRETRNIRCLLVSLVV